MEESNGTNRFDLGWPDQIKWMIADPYSVNIYFLVVLTLIWMSHYVVCWQAGFSAAPAVFLVGSCIALNPKVLRVLYILQEQIKRMLLTRLILAVCRMYFAVHQFHCNDKPVKLMQAIYINHILCLNVSSFRCQDQTELSWTERFPISRSRPGRCRFRSWRRHGATASGECGVTASCAWLQEILIEITTRSLM